MDFKTLLAGVRKPELLFWALALGAMVIQVFPWGTLVLFRLARSYRSHSRSAGVAKYSLASPRNVVLLWPAPAVDAGIEDSCG